MLLVHEQNLTKHYLQQVLIIISIVLLLILNKASAFKFQFYHET